MMIKVRSKLTRSVMAITLCGSMLLGQHSNAQLVVLNPASVAQLIIDILDIVEQYNQVKSQIDQVKNSGKQLETTLGNRDLGALLSELDNYEYMPEELEDWVGMLKEESQGNYGSLTGRVGQLREVMNILDPSIEEDQEAHFVQSRNAAADHVAFQVAANEKMLSSSTERVERINSLRESIAATEDPKAIGELQARISIEQSFIMNEMIQNLAFNNLANEKKNVLEMQAAQRATNDRAEKAANRFSEPLPQNPFQAD